MKKTEIMELRKLYRKKDDCFIRQIAYGYINADKEIKSIKHATFLNLDDGEQFKYLEIIKKGMSGSIGKDILTKDLEDSDMRKALLSLQESEFRNEEMLASFFQQVAEKFEECRNILVILISNRYDVPARGDDGFKNMDDSEDVYDFIQCFFCPVQLENPGLSYDEGSGKFEEKMTRWCVDMPVCSFLYPSFEDRCKNEDKISLFSHKTAYTIFLENLLNLDNIISTEEQQLIFQNVMKTVLDEHPDKLGVIKSIQGKINQAQEVADETGSQMATAKEVVTAVLKKEDIDKRELEAAVESFENTSGEPVVLTENLVKKDLVIKSPAATVKVKVENADIVNTKIIDGRTYLMIDISDDENVTINGISLTL